MRRKFSLVISLLIMCLLIASCGNNPDTGLEENSSSPPESPPDMGESDSADDESVLVIVDDPVAQKQCLTTGVDNFHAEMIYPTEGQIIDPDQPLTIQWELDCLPEALSLILSERVGPNGQPEGSETLIYLTDLAPDTREYTYSGDLNPATVYFSGVLVDTWDNDVVEAEYSGGWVTGPVCKKNELEAPTLRLPASGEQPEYWQELDDGLLGFRLEFSYPITDCTPDGYEVFISTDPSFNTQNYFDELHGNVPVFSIADDYEKIFWGRSIGLDNCTNYFWRAWATAEGNTGPVSETFSITTDFYGDCPLAVRYQAAMDANCRSNPWIRNNEVGIMWEGDTALMLGRDQEGWWGKFLLDNGTECWVHMSSLIPFPEGLVVNHMLYPILPYDPEPEVSGDDGGGLQPVTACMAPDPAGGLSCQSPCPNPSYAGRVCTP